jgi:3',5'-cyclic AMP phosphodiesterase CpdA
MRVAWLTDIHVDFLTPHELLAFCSELGAADADAFLVTGDISVAPSLAEHLAQLGECVRRPFYFVLGNHDFYGGGVSDVRDSVAALCAGSEWLRYLSASEVSRLSDRWALVGHDGWSDGRLGNYQDSPVMLNDYLLIKDLAWLSPEDRLLRMQELAEDAARHLRRSLAAALESHDRVLVGTHVPPFREACWHQGRISNDDWLPHFTSKASGDALLETLENRGDKQVLVLCGHTHGAGRTWPLPNLEVRTGGAVYSRPQIQEILELD